MSEYNTGNPVPSIDPRDLDDNATVFDQLMNSTESSVPDRLGVARKTWYQVEIDAEALVAPNVAALAGLAGAADKGVYFTGAGAMAVYTLSTLMRGVSAQTTQAGIRGAINAMALTDTGAYAGSAAKLTTGRSITSTGDGSWTVTFDGSANVSAAFTLAASGVAAGTYGSVTVNTKGLVTAASTATPVANGGTGGTTQATARSGIGAAASGANGDITSLTGLTTPLSEAQGGTGIGTQTFTNLSLSNSWTVVSTRRAGYRKVTNDLVFLEMQITGGTATDGTLLATLPSGFRPAATIAVPVQSGPNTTPSSSVSSQRVIIGTDGTIVCQNCSSATGISFTATFSTI